MKNFIFLAAMALLVASCNSSSEGGGEYTDSGYRYIHHSKHNGTKPQPGDYVYYKVSIFADDSLVYDSRQESTPPRVVMPEAEALKKNPSPVIDVLFLMAPEDSLTLFYPLDSMPQRPPGYEKTEMIRYEIVADSIQTAEEYNKELERLRKQGELRVAEVRGTTQGIIAKYKADQLGNDLQTTASGLKYVIVEEGDGPVPQAGQLVVTNYFGVLLEDGTEFDESFSRGTPFSFPVAQGRVIPGWDEAFQLLKKGTKAVLFIPYNLAYGEAGSPPTIPPKADLVFYVELEDVR